MKKLYFALFLLFILGCKVNAQTPVVQWEKKLQSAESYTEGQLIFGLSKVNSGGFILVGADTLFGFNKDNYLKRNGLMGWPTGMIIRTDSAGNRIWGFRLHYSTLTSVLTDKNGVLAAGMTYNYENNNKIYLTKYKLDGTFDWEKMYGGNGYETAQSIVASKDSGYLVVGSTTSTNGDVTGNNGAEDIWIIKVGETGNLLWQKCYGGKGNERGYSIVATQDGGYIIAGGDSLSGPYNGLILKTDGTGNKVWQKTYGGSGSDILKAILPLNDGGYIAVGHTTSINGDATGNHGDADVWVLKVNALGEKVWSKCFGGSNEDYGSAIERTDDGGFLITGHTASNDGDVSHHNGGDDIWIIKLDGNGNLLWERAHGNQADEYGAGIAFLSENLVYVLGNKNDKTLPYDQTSTGQLYKLGSGNTIKGKVYLDKNLNGTKDADEPFVSNVMVQSKKENQVLSAIPNNKGAFEIVVDSGKYVNAVLANSNFYNVVPKSVTTSYSNYFNTDSLSFALQMIPGKKDLFVSLMGLTPLRPGFDASHKITYKNQGTEVIAEGTVQMVKSNQLNFVNSMPVPANISGDTLRWNFTNIGPEDSATIYINTKVTAPPIVNNGDVLTSIASILPVAEDITPSDNTSKLQQTVTGSYDPNDKREKHNGKINPDHVANSEWLQYTIRFQNVGSDTAFNIVVRDTLSDKVDLSTLQMISASHSYTLNIKEGNKLTWSFKDILLVDSITNEPLSHGYILYRIKPLNTLEIGDTITNSASIYFDFNLPVITNDEHTIVLAEVLPVNLLSFTAQKSDHKNLLQWHTGNEANASHFEIEKSNNGKDFIQIGLIKTKGSSSYYKLTDEKPFASLNYYRLKMFDKDGSYQYSPIRLVNNATGISIVSLYPNPVKDDVTLKVNSSKKESLHIEIVNIEGKVLLTQKMDLVEGNNSRLLNIARLPRGTYFARMTTEDEQVAIKFEKL